MVYWILGFTAFGLSFIAQILLFLSIKKAQGSVKLALIFLFIAATFYIAHSTLASLFGFLGYETHHYSWLIVPVLYVVAASTWVMSNSVLTKAAKEEG